MCAYECLCVHRDKPFMKISKTCSIHDGKVKIRYVRAYLLLLKKRSFFVSLYFILKCVYAQERKHPYDEIARHVCMAGCRELEKYSCVRDCKIR